MSRWGPPEIKRLFCHHPASRLGCHQTLPPHHFFSFLGHEVRSQLVHPKCEPEAMQTVKAVFASLLNFFAGCPC